MDFQDCACSGKTLRRLVQPAVMALLRDEPLHGYRIVQRLGGLAMFAGDPPDPTGVYRLLKSMEEGGLVVSSLDPGDRGPTKRQFSLTAYGQGCLEQWKRTLQDYAATITDLLATMERTVVPGQESPRSSCCTLSYFEVDGQRFDSLDLKVLLLTQGIHVHQEVHESHGRSHRISADPLECSALFLPDQTVVHIAEVGPAAPFHLVLGPDRNPLLLYRGKPVTGVGLSPASAFYRQTTSGGVPFRGLAVLQGYDVLTFPYLWPCDFAKAGQACRFCHCGNYTQQQWASGAHQDIVFTPRDVAEAVRYAVGVERCAKHIQLTGGSSFNADGECDRIAAILQAIDEEMGLANIPGEIILYTTPPAHVEAVDKLFEAGVTRLACDIELWDEQRARQICPGKSQWIGRQRHLDVLLHVAQAQGPLKACSTFVVGMEPAESFLAGAEYLAANGIVPIPSIWMPHSLPPIPGTPMPDLNFYRQVRKGLAEVYSKYECPPPGDLGFNVCLCRDTWNHRAAILAAG